MEYLAVSIYIESFTVTCLKKTTSHLLIYVYAYIFNKEMVGGLCCHQKIVIFIPPANKVWGVYRNHPVRPSVHVPCKRNSS